MAQMSKLNIKPLTKSLGPFFEEKWSKTTRKHVFYAVFLPFWDHLGTPRWTQKGRQRLASGRDIWPEFLRLKTSPIPNHLAHYSKRNGPKQPEK